MNLYNSVRHYFWRGLSCIQDFWYSDLFLDWVLFITIPTTIWCWITQKPVALLLCLSALLALYVFNLRHNVDTLKRKIKALENDSLTYFRNFGEVYSEISKLEQDIDNRIKNQPAVGNVPYLEKNPHLTNATLTVDEFKQLQKNHRPKTKPNKKSNKKKK